MAPNPSNKSPDGMKNSSRWKMEQSNANITEVNNQECVEIG